MYKLNIYSLEVHRFLEVTTERQQITQTKVLLLQEAKPSSVPDTAW